MEKTELHPRNKHRGRYDFNALIKTLPALKSFVRPNPYGDESIDFANPDAVKTLNRALLKHFYSIQDWDIPEGYLCPPIPGRADLIHEMADLLASLNDDVIPTGKSVRVLDIGIGANCIYPILGHHEYGWSFVGTDIDQKALDSAQKILDRNEALRGSTELRRQTNPENILRGIIRPDESFDLVICNPPFFSSLEEAQAGSKRKWRNLGKPAAGGKNPIRNFGGKNSELWCPGGELDFVSRMISESKEFRDQCRIFTSLVSREIHLPELQEKLARAQVTDSITISLAQGQKKSRILAWVFRT